MDLEDGFLLCEGAKSQGSTVGLARDLCVLFAALVTAKPMDRDIADPIVRYLMEAVGLLAFEHFSNSFPSFWSTTGTKYVFPLCLMTRGSAVVVVVAVVVVFFDSVTCTVFDFCVS